MTSRHIIYHITITVFMTSPPVYLKWHPTTLCHHNVCIDGLTPTVCMTLHPLCLCHPMHSTQRHIHSLWLHTIVVITLHPLNAWHHTHYIWHHTHDNTTLYLPSYPLYLTLHPLYLCHQNRVSIIAQLLSVWYHIDYMCDILFSMHAITTTVYDIIPLCV